MFLFLDTSSDAKIEEVAVAEYGTITSFVEATGVVRTQVGASINVGTRASGTLEKLPYKVGDYVEKGELIALIDDRELQASLRNAKATLERLNVELEMIKNTYPLQIEEVKSRLMANKSNLEYAKKNYEREKKLLEKDFTTQDSVDRAKTNRDIALSDYEVTKSTLARLKEEFKDRKASVIANIKAQEEQINTIEIAISYTKIYAPISGYVAQVLRHEGETVVAQLNAENLITLIDPTKLEVYLYIDETDVTEVHEGSKVNYYVGALPNKWLQSEIKTIWPQPISSGNIVYYVAVVPVPVDDVKLIKPNMTVHSRITTKVKPGALVIPIEALKFVDGETVVYKVDGNKLKKINVEVGLKGDKEIEIVKGLEEGDKVAIKFELPED